jgi:tRNA dimethylallyltransferase
MVAMVSKQEPLLVLLMGPTASGKTALSLALGKAFDGEIISCDSVAVYRGMDVGSAKPSPAEQATLPHHLIDVCDPSTPFTAGDYSRLARLALEKITARGRLPIVTGGTGLYLRALTMGLFDGPPRQQPLRNRLAESAARHSPGWLHQMLNRLDAAAAARIHPNDTPKLIRALEVCFATGKPLTEAFASGRDPLTGYRLLRIGLNPPRQKLYDRINLRAAAMFHNGLVDETRSLLDRFGPVKALDALGYRQALSVLRQQASIAEAIAAAQQGHRNYAKRQLTWFRREPDTCWIEDFGDSSRSLDVVASQIQSSLRDRADLQFSNPG